MVLATPKKEVISNLEYSGKGVTMDPFAALNRATTYARDLDLFRELNLKTFDICDQEERCVGVIDMEWAKVSVFVTCMPSQFWRFKIESKGEDVTSCEFSTGSGCFVDYWPSIRLVAEGMLAPKCSPTE